jgi:hypothetical protein
VLTDYQGVSEKSPDKQRVRVLYTEERRRH